MSALLALAAVGAALLAVGLSPERVLAMAGDAGLARSAELRTGALLARATAGALALVLAAAAWALRRAEPAPAPPRAPASTAAWATLAGLVVLALALRLVRLGQGLWYDEIVTWVEYVRLPVGALVATYTAQNNHLLYSLSAKLAFSVFGEGAFALRLPAAVFGAAGVAALFVFARRVVTTREALLACLILAVSYHHVWFSQNARGYTGLFVATTLGTALFLDGMRRPAHARWVAYALCLALALYVHLSAVFAFATHGLVWLALLALERGRGAARRWPGAASPWPLLGFGLGGLLALQLHAVLIPQIVDAFARQAGTEEVVKVEAWTNPLWTALEVLRGLARLGPLVLAVAGGAAAVGAFGTWRLARRDPVAVALVLLPAPLTLAALLAIHFHVWPRYFFALLGFALVLGVHGVFEGARLVARRVGRPRRLAERTATALLVGAAVGSALTLRAAWVWPKQDFEGAAAFVEAERAPDDRVVTAGLATYPYQHLYAPQWGSVEDAAELEALESAPGRTWLVVTFPDYMQQAHPDLMDRAAQHYERVRVFGGTLGGGEIQVWRRADGPSEGAS